MQRIGYKIFLYILRSLIYLKRAILWLYKILIDALSFVAQSFRNTIGYRLYKIKFQLQKYTGQLKIPWDNKLMELFGKRGTLQIILFIVIFIIIIPHSKLYARDTTKIPGRNTLLYQIVGPGNQDFQLEEISMNFTTFIPKQTDSWNQGTVSAQPNAGTNIQITNPAQQEITGLAAGGTALTKPSIMPGTTILLSGSETGRTEIVIHTVQAGDTIGLISEKYQIDIATILWANNLSARSYIKPGDQLKILPASGIIYKVRRGDTISKIAKTYSTDAEKIIKFNKLQEDGSDIVIGEELMLPDGKMPQPVYVPPPVRKYTQLSDVAAPPASAEAPAGSGYLWPSGSRLITQYFGWRHTAIDIGGKMGTPTYATKAGKVITSQCGWNGGYGCYIKIDHGGGLISLYGHNSKLLVNVGDYVTQGQTISLMGNTGNVRGITGIHLHFEIRINGTQMNPLKYVR